MDDKLFPPVNMKNLTPPENNDNKPLTPEQMNENPVSREEIDPLDRKIMSGMMDIMNSTGDFTKNSYKRDAAKEKMEFISLDVLDLLCSANSVDEKTDERYELQDSEVHNLGTEVVLHSSLICQGLFKDDGLSFGDKFEACVCLILVKLAPLFQENPLFGSLLLRHILRTELARGSFVCTVSIYKSPTVKDALMDEDLAPIQLPPVKSEESSVTVESEIPAEVSFPQKYSFKFSNTEEDDTEEKLSERGEDDERVFEAEELRPTYETYEFDGPDLPMEYSFLIQFVDKSSASMASPSKEEFSQASVVLPPVPLLQVSVALPPIESEKKLESMTEKKSIPSLFYAPFVLKESFHPLVTPIILLRLKEEKRSMEHSIHLFLEEFLESFKVYDEYDTGPFKNKISEAERWAFILAIGHFGRILDNLPPARFDYWCKPQYDRKAYGDNERASELMKAVQWILEKYESASGLEQEPNAGKFLDSLSGPLATFTFAPLTPLEQGHLHSSYMKILPYLEDFEKHLVEMTMMPFIRLSLTNPRDQKKYADEGITKYLRSEMELKFEAFVRDVNSLEEESEKNLSDLQQKWIKLYNQQALLRVLFLVIEKIEEMRDFE